MTEFSLQVLGLIDINSLKIGEVLGVGEFGTVHSGLWACRSGDQVSFIR